MLVEEIRAAHLGLRGEEIYSLLSGGGHGEANIERGLEDPPQEEREEEVEEPQSGEVDVETLREDFVWHERITSKLICEWELFRDTVRSSAAGLGENMKDDRCEWWGEDLGSAERIEDLVREIEVSANSLIGEPVIKKAVGNFDQTEQNTMREEYDRMVSRAGFTRASLAPAGAWVILLSRFADEGDEGLRVRHREEGEGPEGAEGEDPGGQLVREGSQQSSD